MLLIRPATVDDVTLLQTLIGVETLLATTCLRRQRRSKLRLYDTMEKAR